MEAKTELYCPLCKRFLLMAKTKQTQPVKIACRKCKVWIWFFTENKYEVKHIPERTSSSGMRFY